MKWLTMVVLLFLWIKPIQSGLVADKANLLVSISENKTDTASNLTVAWAFSGHWKDVGKHYTFDITANSDYTKSPGSHLDRLQTSWRLISNNTKGLKPVALLQTEGDHFAHTSLNSLFALGIRQDLKTGFIELTFGASKDLRTNQSWNGDTGIEFAYEKNFGRLHFRSGPKYEIGTIGSARFRQDRFRYSWDTNLGYQLGPKLSLNYRLWVGNTIPGARRSQWLGLGITFK